MRQYVVNVAQLIDAGMPNPMTGFRLETQALAQRLYVERLKTLR